MPVRYFLILGAFLISVLMWVDRACISAAKADIATDLGFDDIQMGWVMAAFSLGYALFQVPSGRLADRFGPRIVMSAVVVAWSLFTALTGVVRGLVPMLALRFLFGVGEAGGYPTLARSFYSWLPVGERGITNSISFSGGRLGAALAMPGMVWLIGALGGWQQTFWLFGGIGVGFAVLWFLLFRNSPEEHFAVSAEERDHIAATRKPAVHSGAAEVEVPIGHLLRSRNLLLLMIQYVAHNFTFFFTVTWFFPYLKEQFALSSQQTALYAAAPLLCGVLGNWLAGGLVDLLYRRGLWVRSRRLPAMIGFAMAAIGMTACIHMPTAASAVAAMCLAIFGCDMILSPSWSTCLDIGGRNAGTVSGAMNMVGNLGAFVTSLAFP
ncbi:MAG: MFS transporter, partial [bacterium]|nr:MFS transporter [bacterium]